MKKLANAVVFEVLEKFRNQTGEAVKKDVWKNLQLPFSLLISHAFWVMKRLYTFPNY